MHMWAATNNYFHYRLIVSCLVYKMTRNVNNACRSQSNVFKWISLSDLTVQKDSSFMVINDKAKHDILTLKRLEQIC